MTERVRSLQDVRWSGTLVTSVLALGIAAAVAATELPALLSAMTTSSWSDEGTDAFEVVDTAHLRQAEVSTRRFNGRSPFEVPRRPGTRPAPPPPRRDPPPPPPTRDRPPVASGPPSSYTGPKPVGVAAELVFFENNLEILLGNEEDGVAVIGILGPGRVRLAHKGGEYEVDFLADAAAGLFTEFKPGAASSSPLGTRPEPRDAASPPQPGDRVRVVAEIGGRRRDVNGRIESVSGPSGARRMRLSPDNGGPSITISQANVVSIQPLDGDGASGSSDSSDSSQEPTADENDQAALEHPIPPMIGEDQFRTMSEADLRAAYDPRALALQNEGLDHNTTVRLQNELNIIHDLLRPPPPGG